MGLNILHALQSLLGAHQGLGQPPAIAPRPRNVTAPVTQYQGTYNGYGPQRMSVPLLNPNHGNDITPYSGGLPLGKMNVPNVYTHPTGVFPVQMPAFRPIVQGSNVAFNPTPIEALPPRMVNVAWSPNPVPYAQSLNGPPQ